MTSRLLQLFVLTLALVSCKRSETLKIGIIGPLTGGGAPWGQAAVEAGKILADETNAAGGLEVGAKKYKVEFVAYDDKYNTTEAVSAYNRLVKQDGVKYTLILTGASSAALKKNVEDDKIVALSGSYTGGALLKDSKYMFRYYSDPDQYVVPAVDVVKKNVTGKTVVILNPNDETGWHVAEVGERALKAAGFQVLDKQLYEHTQKDFQPLLTKVLALKPDIIELGSTPPATAGLVVRQARELGFDKTFTKLGGPGPRDIVGTAGAKAAEGTVNVLYADPTNAGYQRLAAAYTKDKGGQPNEVITTYYDAMNVLLHAIQQAGAVDDPTKVAATFAKTLPMKSVQGEEIRLGGKAEYGTDNQFLTTVYVGVIRNGEPVVVGKAL